MTIEGVRGPTKRVGKNNFEVRADGFGRMTDKQVKNYKQMREFCNVPYLYEHVLNLEARVKALEGAE